MMRKLWLLMWVLTALPLQAQEVTQYTVRTDTVVREAYASRHRNRYRVEETHDATLQRRVSLKTNTLLYAFLVGNLAVEVPVSERVSVSLPVCFSALNYFHRDRKYRGFGVQPGVRYYLDQVRLPGRNKRLFVGAHLNLLWFNYANGGTFRYQDADRHSPLFGMGVDAGVKIPFVKHGAPTHWGLEFQAGIGLNRLHIDKFVNVDNGMRVDSYKETRFGPDNLAVSVYYVFGRK